MKPSLCVNQLSVAYGDQQIVHDVSFQLDDKELCAILGLNGSGKTTILKGLLQIAKAKGNVVCKGVNLSTCHQKERAKYLSYIPQNTEFTYSMSVKEYLALGLNPYLGVFENPNKEMMKQIHDVCEILSLNEFIDKDIMTLSGGQKQLVIMGKAIVQNANVLLMDEPDSAMDFANRHRILRSVRSYLKKNQKCALISMHDPNYAFRYCDRIYLMQNGVFIEEINMAKDSLKTIEQKIRLLYDDVELIEHHGIPYMVHI